MQLLIGIGIGACLMWFMQLFIEGTRTPEMPNVPSYWPNRFDTLAAWGRIRAYTVRTTTDPPPPPLPVRVPGASFYRNPPVRTWHVAVKTYAAQDRILFAVAWTRQRIREWWRRIVRRIEEELDPFAHWDMTEWWRAAFYDHEGRHRPKPKPEYVARFEELLSWDRHTTQWLTIVERVEIQRPRGRERTVEEWARIIATNKRTKAIRDAHRARRLGLEREDYALV